MSNDAPEDDGCEHTERTELRAARRPLGYDEDNS
jgi:hypothetical protein